MYQKLCELKDEIERAALQVHGEKVFWYKDFLLEQGTPAELNFQNAVTLLYRLYWEAGNESDVKFLIKKFEVYALDQDKRLSVHFKFVRTLRTFFQHNVANRLSSNTNRTQLECKNWFEKQGANSIPNNDDDWEKCLSNLLTDASDFLNALSKCIGNIEQDEILGSQYVQDWKFERSRYFSANDIDNMIREIAGDMGIEETVNVKNTRDKVMSNWNSLVKTLRYDEDPTTEIKRLIVQDILRAKKRYPLLPEDIINKFNIDAGSREVANLLDKGADFYKENRFLLREQLLEKIQEYVESTSMT
jgi:hypothetical protein